MKALGLKFRVDDLTATPRAVTGVLSQAVLDETLPGLISKLVIGRRGLRSTLKFIFRRVRRCGEKSLARSRV